MATVKAIVRTTKKDGYVKVRFRLSDGRRVQLFHRSDIYVNAEYWDARRGGMRVRSCPTNERMRADSEIEDRKRVMLEVYEDLKKRVGVVTQERFDTAMSRRLSGGGEAMLTMEAFRLYLLSKKNSASTYYYKTLCTCGRYVFRWCRYRDFIGNPAPLTAREWTKSDAADFYDYLRSEVDLFAEYPEFFSDINSEYPDFIAANKHYLATVRGNNTIHSAMIRVVSFFSWCVREEIMPENPFTGLELGSERYGTPYYINIKERNTIADFDLSYNPRLATQRDIFIFQCLIGCRVGDLMRLTAANLIGGAVEYIPLKTARRKPVVVRVPLNERARQLVERYEGKQNDGRLFPFSAQFLYNADIKRIFTICGITRMVTIYDSAKGGDVQRPINEVASSHMARRTFIGNLYKKVQDPNAIGALSGHCEGSRAFARYRTVDEEMKKKMVDLIE